MQNRHKRFFIWDWCRVTWETLNLKLVYSSRSALIINLIFILIEFEMKPNQGEVNSGGNNRNSLLKF